MYLKIGLKNPERFKAIAPMKPAIMPILEFPKEPHKRNSWWTAQSIYENVWGKPFKSDKFLADNPANIAVNNDKRIVIMRSYSKDKDDITGGGAIAIPKGWIKKIEYLTVSYTTQ